MSITTSRDEEILSHLRRLVFSKVNHGIYRQYSEIDPSLSKILRNIKIAINTLKNFTEVERFGESCIAPCACDTLEDNPAFDRDELRGFFMCEVNGREHIPDLLAKFSLILREQTDRCRIIPLVTVGINISRCIYN
ncbi:MAG: hypothetical protein QME58_07065 [Bacteroidota bacterium]|nr:hypothetical protein [Bacteroidota bacterium]